MSPIVAFTDTKGTRHEDVDLPASLMKPGVSRRQQEAYLVSSGQLPGEGELPPMDTPAEIVQATVDAAALAGVEARLSRLERQPAPILPSEAALAAWSQQAARVGLVHSEMAALADQTVATVEGVAAAADERLSSLDAKQAALASTISEALSSSQEATAQAVLSMEQQGAAALSSIEEEALSKANDVAISTAAQVAQEVASKNRGASTVITLEDPATTEQKSFAKRWIGDDRLIDGDGALYVTKNGVQVYRYAGGAWKPGPLIEPKAELISQSTSILDRSTHVAPTISGSGGGSGGSGFSVDEKLTTNRLSLGAATAVADTSNWANLPESELLTSGVLELVVKPLNGGLVGRTYRVDVPFTWESGGGEYTIDGDLGSADTAIEVTVAIQRSPATAAAGFPGAFPLGKNATRVFVTVQAKPGGGGLAGTTQFRVQGSVVWDHEGAGVAIPAGQPMPEPLWYWG